jgi:hypothetical protein
MCFEDFRRTLFVFPRFSGASARFPLQAIRRAQMDVPAPNMVCFLRFATERFSFLDCSNRWTILKFERTVLKAFFLKSSLLLTSFSSFLSPFYLFSGCQYFTYFPLLLSFFNGRSSLLIFCIFTIQPKPVKWACAAAAAVAESVASA